MTWVHRAHWRACCVRLLLVNLDGVLQNQPSGRVMDSDHVINHLSKEGARCCWKRLEHVVVINRSGLYSFDANLPNHWSLFFLPAIGPEWKSSVSGKIVIFYLRASRPIYSRNGMERIKWEDVFKLYILDITPRFATPLFLVGTVTPTSSLGHRPKPVIAIQCLIAKAAHPATPQNACTVLKTGGRGARWRFFMILIAIKWRTRRDCYTL